MTAVHTSSLFEAVLADPRAIAARYPEVFRTDWAARTKVVATLAVAISRDTRVGTTASIAG